MEFELGHTYSGYKFLDVVGRSRSAVQYRVQNTLAQRVENLRTLTAAAVDDPDAEERFLREVRIRARLSHPHIVTFYTAVPIEGRMAMTTELADSLSLAERLKLGPLPWEEALDITRQLLDALACLHQQSFVHCDVTPGNILFGPGGFCKLADFSQARPLDPAHNTESGVPAGNPRYTSPEQVKGERSLDQRSDLYSLGVVLYEMLCGRPPFESRSQFELMMAHVNQAPAPPSSVEAKVPQSLDAVVLKALAKDPADRYPSAPAFSDAIASFHAEAVQADASAVTDSLTGIVPEPAVSGEPEPATAVLELASAGEPAVVEAAAPLVEVEASTEPALEAAPEFVPQSEVIAEAASEAPLEIVTDIHVEAEPAAEVAPELEVAAEPAIAERVAVDAAQGTAFEIAVSTVAEAGVVAEEEIVPAPEAVVKTAEAAAVAEEVIVPTLEAVVETAEVIAEAAVVAEEVIVPAPEAAVETVEAAAVADEVIVPTPEAVVETAEVTAEVAAVAAAMLVSAPVEVVETVEAAAVADEVIVPTPEAVVETAEVIAGAAVVAEEVIVRAPEAVGETIEAVAVADEVIVPTPEAVVETAEAIADAAVVAEEVLVPARMEVVETAEPADVAEEAIVPTPEAVVEIAEVTAEVAAVAAAMLVSAPVDVVETAEAAVVAEEAIVPAPEAVVEAAVVIVDAADVAEEAIVPAPEELVESAEVIAEAAVVAEEAKAAEVIAGEPVADVPLDTTHDALWAAAEMVAKAASANTAPFVPVAPAPLPLAALPPEPVPAPQPEPVVVEPVPAFMTTLRNAPNSLQWAVFGGTAAFLGVIWIAIWFAVGK